MHHLLLKPEHGIVNCTLLHSKSFIRRDKAQLSFFNLKLDSLALGALLVLEHLRYILKIAIPQTSDTFANSEAYTFIYLHL